MNTQTHQATHTPGPWKVATEKTFDNAYGHQRDITAGCDILATVNVRHATNVTIENGGEANARLIAAAPELLEALGTALRVIEQLIPEPSARGVANVVLFQGRAAIARATGGTP